MNPHLDVYKFVVSVNRLLIKFNLIVLIAFVDLYFELFDDANILEDPTASNPVVSIFLLCCVFSHIRWKPFRSNSF